MYLPNQIKKLQENEFFIKGFNVGLNKNKKEKLKYFFGLDIFIILFLTILCNIKIVSQYSINNLYINLPMCTMIIGIILLFISITKYQMFTSKKELKSFLKDIKILNEENINDELVKLIKETK